MQQVCIQQQHLIYSLNVLPVYIILDLRYNIYITCAVDLENLTVSQTLKYYISTKGGECENVSKIKTPKTL